MMRTVRTRKDNARSGTIPRPSRTPAACARAGARAAEHAARQKQVTREAPDAFIKRENLAGGLEKSFSDLREMGSWT